jgi:hypothetical protein
VKRKILTCIFLAVFLCGCVGGLNTGDENVMRPSVGQELVDLKKALDDGAVTQEEYSDLKQKIMDKTE